MSFEDTTRKMADEVYKLASEVYEAAQEALGSTKVQPEVDKAYLMARRLAYATKMLAKCVARRFPGNPDEAP